MSWNDRATRRLHEWAQYLVAELDAGGGFVPELVQVKRADAARDLRELLALLIDNVEPTLTPVREYIDKQLGGA